ncbi:MAG TPA: hypothetical protein VKA46_15475 [Gemmataceae bacterium]|nr:hypothetical protein [Gemmataceae bacterium]
MARRTRGDPCRLARQVKEVGSYQGAAGRLFSPTPAGSPGR